MAHTIAISLPHDLTQEQARQRIEQGIARLRTSYASKVTRVQEQWTQNHLDFHVEGMGQKISGRLEVLAHQVNVEVDLPWMLAMLAGRVTEKVEQEGRRMLEDKSGT